MGKDKKPDKKADKKPDKKQAAVAAKPGAPRPSAPQPAVDPKLATRAVLDAEIAAMQAQLAALKQRYGANDPRLEPAKNRLRLRQIQRAKLG